MNIQQKKLRGCIPAANNRTVRIINLKTSLKTGTKVTDKKSKAVYKVTGDNTVQYTKASAKKVRKAKKVAIPAAVTVNGVKYQVTAIAPNAFKNNKNLKTIIIPATFVNMKYSLIKK